MGVSLSKIQKEYSTQKKCVAILEKLRWGKKRICPHCGGEKSTPVKSKPYNYSCRSCRVVFSVFVDTIFEHTRLPLPKWFMAITMMLNAKSGMSAKELQRNLGLSSYKSVFYLAMRIRIGMLEKDTKLNGLLEMDEAFFGGKPRKGYKTKDKSNANLSQVYLESGKSQSRKVKVAGIVQRKGKVKSQVIANLSKRTLLKVLKKYANKENAILITDAHRSHKALSQYIERLEIKHTKQFSKGIVHINTIEGFWSQVKNGIKGNYKAISPKYLPFYLVEFEWKWNHRTFRGDEFIAYLNNALEQEKEANYGKVESAEKVKQITYK